MKAYARDFRAIAGALKDTAASLETVKAIASVLAGSNPAFDRERFIQAAHRKASALVSWEEVERRMVNTVPMTLDEEAEQAIEDAMSA